MINTDSNKCYVISYFLQNIERSRKGQLGNSEAMVQETPPAYILQLDWKLRLEQMGKQRKILHQPYIIFT